MKKLLLVCSLAAVAAGCKPADQPICPEVYAKQVQFITAQWHADRITTSEATVRLDDLDASVAVWMDEHSVSDAQRALIENARK